MMQLEIFRQKNMIFDSGFGCSLFLNFFHLLFGIVPLVNGQNMIKICSLICLGMKLVAKQQVEGERKTH
jgi:hypothetical protein